MDASCTCVRGVATRLTQAFSASAALLVVGCRVGPDYEAPELPVPDRWHHAALAGVEEGEADLETWWEVFEDEQLEELIGLAVGGNPNLKIAFARIEEVRGLRTQIAANRYPTVSIGGAANARRVDQDILFNFDESQDVYAADVGLGWEIDVWGKISRAVAAADAGLQASVEDYRDVLVILLAQVASNYVNLRTLQQRTVFTEGNLVIQRETLVLTEQLFAAELASEIDVRQAELNLARSESLLPLLRLELYRSVHRISVLLGEQPHTLYYLLEQDGDIPDPPESVAVGIPADRLRNRPDLRAAERRLAAQVEKVGVATADLYPRFGINGSFGWDMISGSSLFSGSAQTWSIGIPFSWTVLNRGRETGNLDTQVAATNRLQAAYEKTFLECLEEVENALFRYAERELRVRNVVMRGDWPTSVPATADQAYADPTIAAIDARLSQLWDRFAHEFSQDGFPERFFRSSPGKPVLQVTPNGVVHAERSKVDGWSYSLVHPTVEMYGDFDVTLQFDDLQQTPDVSSSCGLGLFLGDRHMELIRRHGQPPIERVLATFVTPVSGGGGRHHGHHLTTEARTGTFRLVRRGDTVSALFADNDSSAFRVVGEHTWKNCGELAATLDIRTAAHNRGRTESTWQRFQVAAERLMRLPSSKERQKPVLFTMNSDGSDLKQLTHPMPRFVWHAGPEWSPDGKRIAYDAWTGSASSSHIYIINEDGSDLTDLGIGIIPTFSPDGNRLAFTWSGHGTTIMNVDGTGREVLTREGRGTQWSPDGRWIAYGSTNRLPEGGSAANLTLIDVDTREKRLLLEGEQAARYSHIQWNMGWSPDSREIIFKGNHCNGSEAAITSVDGSSTGFRVVTSKTVSGDFCWHPDGRSILFARGGKLLNYDVETRQIQQLPGQPLGQPNGCAVWDSTGERIVFQSTPKTQSLPW